MLNGLIEELTRATMADYDRLVARLALESEAKRAASDESERTRAPKPRHLPWNHGWRRAGTAH